MFHVKQARGRACEWTPIGIADNNQGSQPVVRRSSKAYRSSGESPVSVQSLIGIRDRMVPMFAVAAEHYRHRVPAGYPNVIDQPDRGTIGLEIDPNYALFITTDGVDLFAEIYRRSPRTDNRAGAAFQKNSGLPFNDRRPLAPNASDQTLRNLIAELMSYFNVQPNLIHITDD